MIEIWYAILAFMLVMFVVLEGFDIVACKGGKVAAAVRGPACCNMSSEKPKRNAV